MSSVRDVAAEWNDGRVAYDPVLKNRDIRCSTADVRPALLRLLFPPRSGTDAEDASGSRIS